MLVGVPGSGKTQFSKGQFDVRLSRDEEGGRTLGLLPKMQAAISEGASKIVLDCTFVKQEDRAPFIDAAHEAGVPIHCIFFDTSKEQAQFNLCWRMVERYGHVLRTSEDYAKVENDPNMFPPHVIYSMFKKLNRPRKEEGFTSVQVRATQKWALPDEFCNKAVIVDYDGTVRRTKSGNKYPVDPSDIKAFPQAARKLQELREEGWILLGASNQSGVARQVPTMKVAHECFQETNRQLGVDIEYDFDYSKAGPIISWHRKPVVGMGIDFIWKHKLDPKRCVVVGDMTTDRTFAARCGFQFEWAGIFFGLTR